MDPNLSETNVALNNRELNILINNLDAGIHIIDKDGYTLFYNSVAEKIDGIKKSDIIGKNLKDFVEKGVFSRSIGLIAIEKKEKIMMTQVVNGRLVLSAGIPIFDGGKLSKVIVIVRDIDRLEKLEQQLNVLKRENKRLAECLSSLSIKHLRNNQLIYRSKSMYNVVQLANRVAKVDSTVLIEGESGVGKGMIAKYIHENSHRSKYPFVKVECSSIPETLIESELFGYEEGAFTGALKGGKKGLAVSANKGTLFLDEIGEISLPMQVKLLSLIQDKKVQPVGSTKKESVDIRIIAATNKNLYNMVKEGKFREDLYYRLCVIPVKIPPLRQRKGDIVPLTKLFLDKLNSYYGLNKSISPKAMKVLLDYNWPGNVRELENIIERLVVTVEGDIIEEKDVLDNLNREHIVEGKGLTFREQILNFEKKLILNYMQRSKSVKEMAKLAGINESTLRKKAKRLGIELEFNRKKFQ
ncbi:MAG: sigma 54-interacting transcriptional regulator [Tissierellia bacterium]|nr:sigma 54-interacting transcriptional regulator [Tissierellia bacterium]